MGRVVVSVEVAPRSPYGMGGQIELSPAIIGGERIAEVFRLAEARAARRQHERERAVLPRRPRYRLSDPPLTADDDPPKGWHVAGTCPECKP